MEKANHSTARNWSSCKTGTTQIDSKTWVKRSKEPTRGLLMVFSWCFCILSLRNFRNQLVQMRSYDASKRSVPQILMNTSRRRVSHHDAANSVDRIATFNDLSSAREVNLIRKAQLTTSSNKHSRIHSNPEISEAISSLARNNISNGGALCIKGSRWYGRTFNRILELANALAMIADDVSNNTTVNETKQTFIGLAPNLSEWYETFFDARKDIRLNYDGPCFSEWTSKDLFFIKEYKNSKKSRQQLQNLLPKKDFRAEAEKALASYSNSGKQQVITVHRRHLEGVCSKKAMGVSVACVKDRLQVKRSMSTKELLDTCNYEYNMIQRRHKDDLEQNKSVVVLCTDQQVPQLDDTFPIRSNFSFPVEAWMMAKSDVHYGNPHSTVDLVVAVWRTGQNRRTHPEQCYEED